MVAGAGVGPGRTPCRLPCLGGERLACGWECTPVASLRCARRCEAGQEREFAVPGEAPGSAVGRDQCFPAHRSWRSVKHLGGECQSLRVRCAQGRRRSELAETRVYYFKIFVCLIDFLFNLNTRLWMPRKHKLAGILAPAVIRE